jgi:hypothetical protein
MPYIPGQKDPLFEAVKGVVTGKTQEGHYARNVLGYEPMQESVRVMEIDPERRERTAESLMGRTGQVGAPGFRYGQRVYYDGEPYRIESFHEADRFYPDLRLTLVDDEFTRRISGVDAIEVTVPTETTAMGEDAEPLEEGERTTAMAQPLDTSIALWSIEATRLLNMRVKGNDHKPMTTAQKTQVQKAIMQAATKALSR